MSTVFQEITGSCSSEPNSTKGLKPQVSYIASLRMTRSECQDDEKRSLWKTRIASF